MTIVRHQDIRTYELQGNTIAGLATPGRGARQVEVWHTILAPGAATPPHVHADEEVVVVLRGRGEIQIGEARHPFEAPCTLIAPAGIPHRLANTEMGPLEALAALPLGSAVATPEGAALDLPWRA
jgi:quercetin dioxygenase-like cupin family protein